LLDSVFKTDLLAKPASVRQSVHQPVDGEPLRQSERDLGAYSDDNAERAVELLRGAQHHRDHQAVRVAPEAAIPGTGQQGHAPGGGSRLEGQVQPGRQGRLRAGILARPRVHRVLRQRQGPCHFELGAKQVDRVGRCHREAGGGSSQSLSGVGQSVECACSLRASTNCRCYEIPSLDYFRYCHY
jgi:hypothetical protein